MSRDGGPRTSVRDPDPEVAPAPDRMRWRWIDLGVILLFLSGAYFVTSAMWTSPSSLTPTANGTDQAFFEWMLTHAVRVFTHGENPFFTGQLNAPIGVNIMSNTGLLGLAIPFAPLTAWLGPSVVFVLIIMLGLAGTATAWYYVMSRHFVGHRFGAFVGATFCGFGPGIITHANAHPNLCVQFVVPFIVWRALALRNSVRPTRDGVILGLLITYQAFLNEEVLFSTALAGMIFALVFALFRRDEARAAARPMLIGLGSGAAVAIVLLAYPLWFQFAGPAHFSGLPTFLQDFPYRLPLASYVTLPRLSVFGDTTANLKYATETEENSFLGWPVLLVSLGIVAVLWRRRVAVRALLVVGLLFAAGSLGNRIVITDPHHSYPLSLWSHLNHLPLFDSVVPTRLAMVCVPVIGLLLAFAVADASRAAVIAYDGSHLGRLSLATGSLAAILAAVVTILPSPVTVGQRGPVPRFFTSGDWRTYVPEGGTVLSATPYDSISNMRWAIAAGLDFGVPGGYFLGPDAKHHGQFGPLYRPTMLVIGSVGAGTWEMTSDVDYWHDQATRDICYWKTAIIVLTLDQRYGPQVSTTINQLVGPGRQIDDVWVWDVRSLCGGTGA